LESRANPDISWYLFPRSFAEAYIIFRKFLSVRNHVYEDEKELSVFDFGCGTGGELAGFMMAVADVLPQVKKITIHALDGNHHALRFLEVILQTVSKRTGITLTTRIQPVSIDDYYDLKIIKNIAGQNFDFIITFKAICEFVTKKQFFTQNPYEYFLNTFLPKLGLNGVICIADISTRNRIANEWLPKMIDRGALSCVNAHLLDKNDYYNVSCTVNHSRKFNDLSKITWRIYKYGVSK